MSLRMRIVGWQVTPIIMTDDGELLKQQPVEPQFISAENWKSFKDGGDDDALEGLRKQIEK